MKPSGKLVIIGGAVDTGSATEKVFNQPITLNFFEHGILKRIIAESPAKENSRVEVLTTASLIPDEVGDEYIKAFGLLNVTDVGLLNITTREEANSPEIVERLAKCDIIMMSGGDQLRLTSILGGTKFHQLLLERYRNENFIIAGTSAGAAAASGNMIYQGSSKEALLKGEIKITGGLGFINEVIVDTHFVHRGRIGRLIQAVASNPMLLGIGLGEDTGLLITDGHQLEAIGSGLIILVDGRSIKNTNISDVPMGTPISIENVIVHVMAIHDFYDLNTHKMTLSSNRKEFEQEADRLEKMNR